MNPLQLHALDLTRRRFLGTTALTLGAPALQSLRAAEGGLPALAHFAPKAKRVIDMMQTGDPTHVDLFDDKPELRRRRNQDIVKRKGSYAYNCLMARRLAERGVRYVQLIHAGWDQHGNLPTQLPIQCKDTDQPSAALVKDLKMRGLLDDTLVIWGGEFGRTPFVQGDINNPKAHGHDHHPLAFTMWLAGGGVKRGCIYGSSDDFTYHATEDQNTWTKATYGDCVLDFEFKFEPGANSGVFLYNSDETKWMPASIEIQICDDRAKQWQEKPTNWRCGTFFGHQPATKSTVKPAGKWNRMTITAMGPKITVVLNNEVVNEIDLTRWKDGKLNPDSSEMPKWLQGRPWSEMPTKGRIGFQGRHAGAGIEFRKVKLLRL